MKRTLHTVAAMAAAVLAARSAVADRIRELNDKHHFPDKRNFFARPGGGGNQNLANHGGPVIHSARAIRAAAAARAQASPRRRISITSPATRPGRR